MSDIISQDGTLQDAKSLVYFMNGHDDRRFKASFELLAELREAAEDLLEHFGAHEGECTERSLRGACLTHLEAFDRRKNRLASVVKKISHGMPVKVSPDAPIEELREEVRGVQASLLPDPSFAQARAERLSHGFTVSSSSVREVVTPATVVRSPSDLTMLKHEESFPEEWC